MQDNINLEQSFNDAKRQLFDKVYGQKLNPEQCNAVFTAEGPVLVLAGAGSGKTTVLVNRIAYLIKYGNAYYNNKLPDGADFDTVEALRAAYGMEPSDIEEILPQFIFDQCPPWQVLAITFTNKAAKEIKDRLLLTFDDKEVAESVWAGTFHSICLRILRKHGEKSGYREGFSIYDTDDKKRMVVQCMKDLEIDEKTLAVKSVCNAISMAKDALESPEDYGNDTMDPRAGYIKQIYELYQKKMMEYNAVDFDDIIMKTVELFRSFPDILTYYQNKFRYVLVDEYQDTNLAQFELTRLIADKRRNIMVVGDDDQSIYRFRGATVENILNFDKTYPDATVVKLEQNYRSTGNILSAANAVIHHNDRRHDKKLWCDKGDGEKIVLKDAYDQNDEGRYIVNEITKGIFEEKKKYSDFAVLYRINAMGRSLQTAFTKSGMPFKVVGDIGFYDRKEVKDMIAYISVISFTGDNLRLKRIINEPKRKIGSATVEALETIAEMNGMSMFDVMERVDEYPVLSKSALKLKAFVNMINEVKREEKLPSEIITEIFEKSGYHDMLIAEGFEGEGKIENVQEFISAALEYENRMRDSEQEPTLLGFLEEVYLISDVDKYDENADAVTLMTIHAAKGLEFPVVFLAGMEDGIFPSEQNLHDEEQMSEERRLAYVAITRAKEKLYITYAKDRIMYGKTLGGSLSCFVRNEIPEDLIVRDKPRQIPPRQASSLNIRPKNSYNNSDFSEFRRNPDMMNNGFKFRTSKRGAEGFGIEKFSKGTRVKHAMFGEGTVISSKDLGGDVLYEVEFESVGTKRLMATFAKLEKV